MGVSTQSTWDFTMVVYICFKVKSWQSSSIYYQQVFNNDLDWNRNQNVEIFACFNVFGFVSEHSNTVKYFLFQSMGSIILLLRISLLRELKMLRILVTMMKLGIAPFHLWFISLMRKISIMRLV